MKNVFYKNFYTLWINTISHITLAIIIFLIIINLKISFSSLGIGALLFWGGAIFPIIILVEPMIFERRKLFSKIIIDETGIKVVFRDQLRESHKWTDVEDVIKASMTRNQELKFTLKSKVDGYNNDILYFNVDRKIKEALLFYCNNEEIREKIEKVKLLY